MAHSTLRRVFLSAAVSLTDGAICAAGPVRAAKVAGGGGPCGRDRQGCPPPQPGRRGRKHTLREREASAFPGRLNRRLRVFQAPDAVVGAEVGKLKTASKQVTPHTSRACNYHGARCSRVSQSASAPSLYCPLPEFLAVKICMLSTNVSACPILSRMSMEGLELQPKKRSSPNPNRARVELSGPSSSSLSPFLSATTA